MSGERYWVELYGLESYSPAPREESLRNAYTILGKLQRCRVAPARDSRARGVR
jgi:hypothetical protein